MAEDTRTGTLAGLKVIEIAGFGPGPLAGMMLADHGAEVIRIERTGGHDHGFEVEQRFFVYNRGKRSLALDLKAAEGLAVLMDLIAGADVLIEGFRPGVAERLGYGPDACLERNPALVYARITGWGQTGPLAMRAGHDINYAALAGVIGLIGPADGPPVLPLNLVADFGGGAMSLAFGVLAALNERGGSGRGQVVDVAMAEGCLTLLTSTFGYLASGFHTLQRGQNLLDGGVPYYSVYETADGGYMAVGALEPQFFALLCDRLELDPRWLQRRADPANWPELRAELQRIFLQRPRSEWERLLGDCDVCVTPVLSPLEAAGHAQFAARDSFLTRDGIPQPAPQPRFSRTAAALPGAIAAKGEDSADILRQLGRSEEEIAALRAAGVFADC